MNVTCKCRNDTPAAGLAVVGAAHADVLAAIHGSCFPTTEIWDAAALAAQLALPGVFALLDPAGGLVLARVAADEAEILTLAVAPDARRAGRGRALLAGAECHAKAVGARTMFLEVAADNAAARALYAAAGYRRVGERRGYYPDGRDALVLARGLIPAATEDG